MADCTYPKCQQTAIPGCQGLCRDLSVNRRATDGQRAGVPVAMIRAEISLILSDPDSDLSDGAVRALRCIDQAIAAAPTPPARDAGQEQMEAALRTIAEWPVTPAGNMDAENMRRVAGSALAAATAPGAPGREAEHPAAQAAGLTDEGIIGIAELDGVATYETGWYRMTRGGLLAFARALLSRAAPSDSAEQAQPVSQDAKRLEWIVSVGWDGLRQAWERYGEVDCEDAITEIRAVIDAALAASKEGA